MRMFKLYMLAILTASMAFAMGCDNDDPSSGPRDTDPEGDGGDPDGGMGDFIPDTTECDATKTCAALRAAGEPERCIADFSLGTCQAGNEDIGYDYIGFYGYNDSSPGATQNPKVNPDMAEAAVTMLSCDPDINSVAPFIAQGFTEWGADIGMDWGGEANPACDEELHPGALDCLDITYEDNKWRLAAALEDPRCARDDADEQQAMEDCLTKGKAFKEVRDLTGYVGIGFWVLTMEDHEASAMKISLPIPETTRFYTREEYEGQGCTDEDDIDSNDCFNDFARNITFSKQDVGKWVYKEILFDDAEWNPWWGLQLDALDPPINSFPLNQSVGIKMQVDKIQSTNQFPNTHMYIDDVILVK